jgi:hypothetical protein
MNKETYDRIAQAIDVPSHFPELMDFMIVAMRMQQQVFAAAYHADYREESKADQKLKLENYYDSLACDRAIEWLEEIKKQ